MRTLTAADSYPLTARQLPCFIGGEFISDGRPFDNVSPVTGRVLCSVTEADAALVDRAVLAARAALRGPWGRMSVAERAALLRKVAERIEQRFEEFLSAEIADTGKTLKQARTLDIPRGAANFRAYADLALGRGAECFETATPDGRGALNYSVHKPVGVVAVIVPWNLPFLLMTWKVAPALACGNAVIVKPSEETPSTAVLLAQVMQEVGMPAGVFNVVHGFGEKSTGEALVSHPEVNAVAFTGETATGAAIMKCAAPSVKALSFELGGKNAALVFADADFEAALAGTMRSVFSNCGQVCLSSERVYIERPIFERFVTALVQRARALKIGGPYEEPDMGPLISRAHREKVLAYYKLAREERGETLCGGGIPSFGDERDGGAFIEPTVLAGLAENARCVKEEIFGPVCHVAPFDAEDEAVRLANDTRYGLCAALWTQNLSRAHRVARQMEVGTAWVNDWYLRDLRVPFGGVKLSGIGSEGGEHSLAFFSESMNVCVKL
ncbi:MAG TPA: 2-hydroxymuconic semialdehyde dehydrogenase [Steroidobacteraceae bacterium]|jgi:aminomuconate-semialdehyde/2-hydroxymuconate-6-semialdehyde dehydrogenase|nr:2-hydroxymuconic semialdehyde dehydrogenase [Steroidobacteraceae bacterium]